MGERFIRLAGASLKAEQFGLLDIGCSGGIAPVWRAFEPRLRALGIDASETECARLAALERNPDVAYVAAFVSGSAAKPVDLSSGPASPLIMRMVKRLSFTRVLEMREARLRDASNMEKLRHNAWQMTGLADRCKPVVAPELLAERGWTSVDYLKIDVDGADFDILRSFERHFSALGMLAAQLEVNFVGNGSPDEHSFHNTDRFMRQHGFDLFRLDNRTYSTRALPARFAIDIPAQTVGGRILQGDAFYARDPIAAGAALTDAQLVKLICIFSAWELPDAAAEILLHFRERFSGLDIEHALDVLSAQAQRGDEQALPYRAYMAEFEREAPRFFPPAVSVPARVPNFWRRMWR
jgi:Methyltransferase FkbM domain